MGDVMQRVFCVKNRLIGVCLALLLALSMCIVPLLAADTAYEDGRVLFAARFKDYSYRSETGTALGTLSWPEAKVTLADGVLHVRSSSDQKTYLLLPEEIPSADTYTVVYEFRFSDVAEPGGYCGFILTSSGDGPSNRTELILRANGSCDGVGQFSDAMAAALQSGTFVRVTIPIRHGMLSEIRLSADGQEEVLDMANVRTVAEGRRGFVFRNASADLRLVKVVAGVDYASETGYYAKYSYRAPDAVPDTEDEEIVAPPTGEKTAWLIVAVLATGGLLCFRRRRYA